MPYNTNEPVAYAVHLDATNLAPVGLHSFASTSMAIGFIGSFAVQLQITNVGKRLREHVGVRSPFWRSILIRSAFVSIALPLFAHDAMGAPMFVRQWSAGNQPRGIALGPSGDVYVVGGSNAVLEYSHTGQLIQQIGHYGINDGLFDFPIAIAIDQAGYMYVADNFNNRIQKLAPDGTFVTAWGSPGTGIGEFNYTQCGIACDDHGDVYVTNGDRIEEYTDDGVSIRTWGSHGHGPGQFNGVGGIAVGADGNVYAVDAYSYRIQEFTSDGVFLTAWGSEGTGIRQLGGFDGGPVSIAVDGHGNVYVSVSDSLDKIQRIEEFTDTGQFIRNWGAQGYGYGTFSVPWGIAVNGLGDIYVADDQNGLVQQFFDSSVPEPSSGVVILSAFFIRRR